MKRFSSCIDGRCIVDAFHARFHSWRDRCCFRSRKGRENSEESFRDSSFNFPRGSIFLRVCRSRESIVTGRSRIISCYLKIFLKSPPNSEEI